MVDAQLAFAKEKRLGADLLNEEEKTLIEKARKLQDIAISVDSFSEKEYFR